MNKKYLSLAIPLAMTLASCSHGPVEPPPPKNVPAVSHIETMQVAAEQNAANYLELQFKKGAQELAPTEVERLQHVLKQAHARTDLKEIEVITWADEEYPADSLKKLSKASRDLAKSRNQNLEGLIRAELGDVKITTLSMAERPGALKKFLKSSDARIKDSLEFAGIATSETKRQVQKMASKSIVLVVTK